mgnify:FL=1
MERKKLVALEILLTIGLIIIICFEIYIVWNLLKTNEYELEINNSNRKFISNYFENSDEIVNITYKFPLHNDVYKITYSNGTKKEIVNNEWINLENYIKENGNDESFIYYLLFILTMMTIVILIILNIIVGNKINKIDRIIE